METGVTFGVWLRQRRRQLDLTQAELAARIDYSVVTIRKLERDEQRPSKQLAERLAKALDIAVEQQAGVSALARTSAVSSPAGAMTLQPGTSSHLPPQLTRFYGRTRELLELEQLLTDPTCRLLTLVGPGGIGKTRLALEVAQAQVAHMPDGIYFVALAPLSAADHIIAAIAATLDLIFQADPRPLKQQLFDHLRDKRILLLLDNFEHLHDGTHLIQEMLQHCPKVRLLVTARERLHLSSETVFTLAGMDVPTGAAIHEALTFGAVQLFLATARRTRPGFVLDETNAQDVVWICRLVGGMPLGIILAAVWVEVLSPAEIAAELQQGSDFLQSDLRDLPERHQSMRLVLTQTWQRLTQVEQSTFMRLAVFHGGFTREAAQKVAGASLQTLASLANKTLIQRDDNRRYSIHELLRQYAETELEVAGLSAEACSAHSVYYTSYLQQRERDIKGARQVAALDEVERDFENVRAAWQWAVVQRNYAAIGGALESLYWFCEMRSRVQDGLELLRSAREQLAPTHEEQPHPEWGRLMSHVLGQDMRWFEPPSESIERIKLGLEIAQAHENKAEVAFGMWRMAINLLLSNDVKAAIDYLEESMAQYRALDDHFYLARLQRDLGFLYLVLDQSRKSYQLIDQAVTLCREVGDLNGLAQPLAFLGWFAYNDGQFTAAEAHWQETREICVQIRASYALVNAQLGLTWLDLFAKGNFSTVRSLAEELQLTVLDSNDTQNKHRWLLVSGYLAGMDEDYLKCHHCFQEAIALHFPYFPYMASLESMGICLAACGIDDVPNTGQHLQRVLEISLKNEWPVNAAKALALVAALMVKANKPQQATELLGLVFHHPQSPKGWLMQWPLITRLRNQLEATLTPQVFTTIWRQGGNLNLMQTAATILAEMA